METLPKDLLRWMLVRSDLAKRDLQALSCCSAAFRDMIEVTPELRLRRLLTLFDTTPPVAQLAETSATLLTRSFKPVAVVHLKVEENTLPVGDAPAPASSSYDGSRGEPAPIPTYFCIGLVDSALEAVKGCEHFTLALFSDGDVVRAHVSRVAMAHRMTRARSGITAATLHTGYAWQHQEGGSLHLTLVAVQQRWPNENGYKPGDVIR